MVRKETRDWDRPGSLFFINLFYQELIHSVYRYQSLLRGEGPISLPPSTWAHLLQVPPPQHHHTGRARSSTWNFGVQYQTSERIPKDGWENVCGGWKQGDGMLMTFGWRQEKNAKKVSNRTGGVV
jgi:hypothetical protein